MIINMIGKIIQIKIKFKNPKVSLKVAFIILKYNEGKVSF